MLTTVWNTQRGSQSYYTEKRRGRREIEVTRRRRRAVKSGETDLASNQFPKCSPQPRTPSDSQSEVEKRRRREEREATWWRKRKVQRGREQSSQ